MAVFAGLLFELFHSTSPVTPPLQHRRSLVQNQSLAIAILWRSTALLNVLHLVQHQIRFAGLQLRTSASQLSGRNPQRSHLTSAESEAACAFDFLRWPLIGILHLHAELRPLGVIGTVTTLDGHQVNIVHGAVLAHGYSLGRGPTIGTTVGLLSGMAAVPIVSGRVVKGGSGYLDAGGNRRSALLIAFGASIALATGDAVLARTLSTGLVANFSRGPHRVAVARLASLFAGDGFF